MSDDVVVKPEKKTLARDIDPMGPVVESVAIMVKEGKIKDFNDFENMIRSLFLGDASRRGFSSYSMAWQALRFPMTPLDKSWQIYVLNWLNDTDWQPYKGDANAHAYRKETASKEVGLEQAKRFLVKNLPELSRDNPLVPPADVKEILKSVFSLHFPGIAGRPPFSKRLGSTQQKASDLIGSHYGENLYIKAHPEALNTEIRRARNAYGDEFSSYLALAESAFMKQCKARISELWPDRQQNRDELRVLFAKANAERISVQTKERELVSRLFTLSDKESYRIVGNAMKFAVSDGRVSEYDYKALKKAAESYGQLVNYGGIGVVFRDAMIVARKLEFGDGFNLAGSAANPDVVNHPVVTVAQEKAAKKQQATEIASGQIGLF